MLNKLLFNNLIISNKKKLKQARVQTINKFVQKLRKLQQLQGKQPEDLKIKDKIRRTIECVEFSKKLKPHDMIKRTLILEKGPLAVLSNDRATPDEISFATLALNKIIQNLLQDFKEKLELKDDDVEWKQAVLAKSKRREKIEKTEEKKRKRKELKEQKLVERKRKEWLEQNTLNNNETKISKKEEKEKSQDSSVIEGEWQVEELSNPEVNSDKTEEIILNGNTKSEQNSEDKSLNIRKPNTKKKEIKTETLKNKNKEVNLIKKETKPQNKTKNSKKSEENILKNFSTSRKAEGNVTESEGQKIPNKNVFQPKEVTNIKITKVFDPFFLTDTGENYLATAIIYPEEASPAKDSSSIRNFNNKRESRIYKDASNFQKLHQHPKRFDNDVINPISNEIDNTLHPSWQAKLKQKRIITNSMANKKIKFDDDGGSEVISKPVPSIMNSKQEISTFDNKDLHPSWAAKQKIKPVIKEFQGKKITFDDD